MICGKCGKTGHNNRTCGRASKTGRPHAAIGIKRKCKKCGQMGHMAKTCDGVNGGCASWLYKKAALLQSQLDQVRQEAESSATKLRVSEYEVIIYDPRKRRRERIN